MNKLSVVLFAISIILIVPSANAEGEDRRFGSYEQQPQTEKSEDTEPKNIACERFPTCALFIEKTEEPSLSESNQDKKSTKSNIKLKASI